MDAKGLCAIFSFGSILGECSKAAIDRLAGAIKAGQVQVEAVTLPQWDEATYRFRFSEGTGAHKGLCAQCAIWLESRGHSWGHRAYDYPGGRADLVSDDGTLAVECGYTKASKVNDALERGVNVLVAPYSLDDTAYLFTGRMMPDTELEEAQRKALRGVHVPYLRRGEK